jgi:hypothetical protein
MAQSKLSNDIFRRLASIPVTTIRQGGLVYQQRSFVAYGKPATANEPRWVNNKPLFVSEITVTNPHFGAECLNRLDFIATQPMERR